jgi:NDP-sugar pyrophosphorylase family protein
MGLRQLLSAGCRVIAVNGHHLCDDLRGWLESRAATAPGVELRFFSEPVLLGVGGGLARMARELPPGPLLVQNGDVIHDGDLGRLLDAARGADICLALGGLPRVVECRDGHVLSLRRVEHSTHGFTGVHAWSEAARERLCDWKHPDLIPFLQAEIDAGREVRGTALAHDGRGSLWEDLGHLPRYLPLHTELWARAEYRNLLERLELSANWDAGRAVSLGRGSRLPDEARNCVAWDGVGWQGSARDCVFLDGVRGQGEAAGEILLGASGGEGA